MTARPGHTLAELLVAAPLALLLLALLVATFLAQARLARGVAARIGRAETERVAHGVLRGELLWAGRADVRAAGGDSLALRLLRGVAFTCGPPGSAAIVHYSGMRQPNARKDSVLVVHAAGETPLEVASVAVNSPCGGVPALRLGLDPPATRGVLLLYESGTYYLSGRALRFRAGAEGRQPLSEEWIDDAGSALLVGDSGVALHLRLRDASPQRWPLARLNLPAR